MTNILLDVDHSTDSIARFLSCVCTPMPLSNITGPIDPNYPTVEQQN